ncbi:MAG: pyridoxal-phosphate dependent enzyme [Bacteroidia bacterium]|nr:pyridoxal-phosphate dependent enzyme [Bacteroidia bacterium]
MLQIPSLTDIEISHKLIQPFIHQTPVFTNNYLNELVEAELFFKCENFQKVGAFKMRGASNAVNRLELSDLKSGVATHSSGNHAAALALAAKQKGIPAFIVMPSTAPPIKKNAVKSYGGTIIECAPTLEARESTLHEVVKNTGATFIHPFDNYSVIAGQSTAALELLRQTPQLDYLFAPVGGGGLLSGTALITSYLSPSTLVIGAEPLGANDAFISFNNGILTPVSNPKTIADGLLTSLSEKTFSIIRSKVQNILLADETTILEALKLIWERMKIIIEPSSALPLATILLNKSIVKNKKVGIILSGGNADFNALKFN